ncbi:MAG: class I SAM-dependent methyltransferase [Candidatus Magasanikbacteria bacterium]
MVKTTTINSQDDLIRDFFSTFQEYRIFKQKAFYMGKNADVYYQLSSKRMEDFFSTEETYYLFLKENILQKGKKVAFISLGCGNAEKELHILKLMKRDGYDAVFVAVDSSEDMIGLAKKTFEKENFDVQFVCADFSSPEFFDKFSERIVGCDFSIYTFLGATFGNVEQSYMADIIFDLLNPGDKLWLEVVARDETTKKDALHFFEKYYAWLSNDTVKNFLNGPLKELGIKPENGEIYLQMIEEDYLKSLKFVFRLKIKKKTVIHYQGKTTVLLPDNVIDLMTIRAYDAEGLVGFFKERNFQFIAQKKAQGMGQFLFEKK